jgi:protein ImuA
MPPIPASLPAHNPLQRPDVWRGRELAPALERTLSTGHPPLDQHLPGGGWPLGTLVEVLQQQAQQHVWQLMLPALVAATRQHPGPVVLVGAPLLPFGPALRGQGFAADRLLCVQAEKPAARLWAAEQALRCGEVAAVLAWLPRARSEDLRRLHLVAQQQPDRLLTVFRESAALNQATPARLRLLVGGVEQMEVQVLKRRGPPLLQAITLRAQSARLAAWLASRRARKSASPPSVASNEGSLHAMDRTAAFAP